MAEINKKLFIKNLLSKSHVRWGVAHSLPYLYSVAIILCPVKVGIIAVILDSMSDTSMSDVTWGDSDDMQCVLNQLRREYYVSSRDRYTPKGIIYKNLSSVGFGDTIQLDSKESILQRRNCYQFQRGRFNVVYEQNLIQKLSICCRRTLIK